MDNEEEISITQAAALKGVTRPTIHRAIREGRLPARWEETTVNPRWTVQRPAATPRGVWKIRREDLDVWQPASTEERARRAGSAPKKPRAKKESE